VCRYETAPTLPTYNHAPPVAPGQARTIDEMLSFGKAQWGVAFGGFARQWSQPKILRLCEGILGTRSVHSSQIHGFLSGKLRDPSPKIQLALGHVNRAIAKANGFDCVSEFTCPGSMEELWKGKAWLTDADSAPLGPQEVFMAFSGQIDLGLNSAHVIEPEQGPAAVKALGRFLRMELAKQGTDWMDEIVTMRKDVPCIEPLLMGQDVEAAVILTQLKEIAALVGMTDTDLWQLAIAPALILDSVAA